jgi:hypothetical protein
MFEKEYVFAMMQKLAEQEKQKDRNKIVIGSWASYNDFNEFVKRVNNKDKTNSHIGKEDNTVNLTQNDLLKILKLVGFTKEYELQDKLVNLLTNDNKEKYYKLDFYDDVKFIIPEPRVENISLGGSKWK